MSMTTAPVSLSARRHSAVGALLGLLAWLALIIAPIAAQAMTRIDPGLPGATICSINKAPGTESGPAMASHCPLCTLAQQAVDVPQPVVVAPLTVRVLGFVSPPSSALDPVDKEYRGHPPRAPPLA
jgi:hypothetical protein